MLYRASNIVEIGTGLAVSCFPTIQKPRPYCDLMALVTKLKEYREQAGLKQSELAEKVGARRETVAIFSEITK